ncbi:Tyrosine phosphorylated protein A [Serratia fonticola]|uniref:Tyrosine phosphorylated protein A n=1 Tax=Serratia fonticola TaxID=47917 RepID=A0A4U9TMI6_SERFO|nr:Tyrosine phosphorylated protein A [Serratia fonticola]
MGIAGLDHNDMSEDMTPLYQAIVDHVSAPQVELEAPFQMQISQLDYNNYVGVIASAVSSVVKSSLTSRSP